MLSERTSPRNSKKAAASSSATQPAGARLGQQRCELEGVNARGVTRAVASRLRRRRRRRHRNASSSARRHRHLELDLHLHRGAHEERRLRLAARRRRGDDIGAARHDRARRALICGAREVRWDLVSTQMHSQARRRRAAGAGRRRRAAGGSRARRAPASSARARTCLHPLDGPHPLLRLRRGACDLHRLAPPSPHAARELAQVLGLQQPPPGAHLVCDQGAHRVRASGVPHFRPRLTALRV